MMVFRASQTVLVVLVLAGATAAEAVTTCPVRTIREATASGPEAAAQAGIQATVDAFRADLGNPNNGNAVGSQGPGRRQITWDGADNDSAPARLAPDFFNAVAPRGAIYGRDDPRAQFQQSADATPAVPGTPTEFGNVNATYPTAFAVFSSPRLFTALTNNVLRVDFFIPGTDVPAVVSGFGAVFTDVDVPGSSQIRYFGPTGEEIFSRQVLATPGDESLSFLGVSFVTNCVSAVELTVGAAALGPNDVTQTAGNPDIVALDDFIYGEPNPATSRLATGPGAGGGPHVRMLSGTDGNNVLSLFAYDPAFTGGASVALGDVNGDGVLDLVTGAGPGGGPHVKVFDGATGAVIRSFFAYDPSFTGGVFVATGNVDGDANADIVTGAGQGGGPHVRVFSGSSLTNPPAVLFELFAFDPAFTGGVRVATADLNADFLDDVIAAAGPGGAPHVRAFNAVNPAQELKSFLAFDTLFAGGLFIAACELSGDTIPDFVVGAGPGGPPHVRSIDGSTLTELPNFVGSFFPYDPNFTGGVRVACGDVTGNNVADVVTGAGPGGGPHVRAFDSQGGNGGPLRNFFPYDPSFLGGVFVAADRNDTRP